MQNDQVLHAVLDYDPAKPLGLDPAKPVVVEKPGNRASGSRIDDVLGNSGQERCHVLDRRVEQPLARLLGSPSDVRCDRAVPGP